MNALKTAVIGLTLISGVTLARADVITDWNKAAIHVMQAINVAGNPWTRTLAMMHVSMSDSVNAIQDRYGRFTPELPKDPNASAEAAAAAAAREILVRQYPDQKTRIDEAFGATLASVPDGPARAAGIALGEKVAATVFADRQNDATNAPDTYRPMTQPGVWVPTTRETLGAAERQSVPAGSAAGTLERSLCARLQRNQGIGGSDESQADRRPIRCRAFLDDQSGACVVPGRDAGFGPKRARLG